MYEVGKRAQNIGWRSSLATSFTISKLDSPGIINIGGNSLIVRGPCEASWMNSGVDGAILTCALRSSKELGKIKVNSKTTEINEKHF